MWLLWFTRLHWASIATHPFLRTYVVAVPSLHLSQLMTSEVVPVARGGTVSSREAVGGGGASTSTLSLQGYSFEGLSPKHSSLV